MEFRKISKTRGRGVKKSLGIRDGSDGIRVLFLSKSREMIRRCGENGAGSEASFKMSAIRFSTLNKVKAQEVDPQFQAGLPDCLNQGVR